MSLTNAVMVAFLCPCILLKTLTNMCTYWLELLYITMFLGCCDDVVLLFIAHISHPHRPQPTAFYFFCFNSAHLIFVLLARTTSEPRVDMRAARDLDKGASKDIL